MSDSDADGASDPFRARSSIIRTPPGRMDAKPAEGAQKRVRESPGETIASKKRTVKAKRVTKPSAALLRAAQVDTQEGMPYGSAVSSDSDAEESAEREGLTVTTKAQLMDRAHKAVTAIAQIAIGDTSKLNKNDIRDINMWGQEILAVVAHLDLKLAEMELDVAKHKLEAAKARAQVAATGRLMALTPSASEATVERISYAGALKIGRGAPPKPLPAARGPVIAIYPASEESAKTAEETKKIFKASVDPAQMNIQVDRIKKIGNAGVIVQTTNMESAMKIKGNPALTKAGLKIREPKQNKPLVKFGDMDSDIGFEKFLEGLAVQNNMGEEWSLEQLTKHCKLAFKKRRRGFPEASYVIECSPELKTSDQYRSGVYWLEPIRGTLPKRKHRLHASTSQAAEAAVIVSGERTACAFLSELSNDYCSCVHVRTNAGDVYLVSAYFKYSHRIEPHLEHLQHVLNVLKGKKIVICADTNTHSPVWHSRERQFIGRGSEAEERRAQMECFLSQNALNVENREGQPPTFSGPGGTSNIDVTITSRRVIVDDWKVIEGASLSDHQLIVVSVNIGEGRGSMTSEVAATNSLLRRFRDRDVNWDRFRTHLLSRAGALDERKSAEEYARDLCGIIERAAHACLGEYKSNSTKRYEWWNAKLDALRHRFGNARRKWQRLRKRTGRATENARETFVKSRSEYRRAMAEAQESHFRNMADSGNENPWGLAYRTTAGRSKTPGNVINCIRFGDGAASNVDDAIESMLCALLPDDDTSDSVYHRQIRIAALTSPSGAPAPPIGAGRLGRIIRKLPNTSPGIDGITAKIVKEAWKAIGAEMNLMYEKCVIEGIFPGIWKEGRLVLLPKGSDRPATDPKAYRPLTLLPVLGKILERVIIQQTRETLDSLAGEQHGFTRGRSTVTALTDILGAAGASASKYVQLVFLDISGAFDNAWWPMILVKLKQRGCPPNIYNMMVDYFSCRRVGLFVGCRAGWKATTMGCPQGSVLGPTLWNLLLSDVFRLPMPGGCRLIAYADDVTAVIGGDSRAELERKGNTLLSLLAEWGRRNRLVFSPIAYTKVLGLGIDSNLSFGAHARDMGTRAAKCFGRVSRVSTSSWGLRYPALKIIYRGTFVAVITYAAAVWFRRANFHVVRSALLRAQRPALILLTKAYRSTSTHALPVLAGVLPADLEVARRGEVDIERSCKTKKEISALFINSTDKQYDIWQERWESAPEGRELYSFFPDVRERMNNDAIEPDYVSSQMLTGHGCFRKRLYEMKLSTRKECDCGWYEETRDHVLWYCPLYDDDRKVMMDKLEYSTIGPVHFADLTRTSRNFKAFRVQAVFVKGPTPPKVFLSRFLLRLLNGLAPPSGRGRAGQLRRAYSCVVSEKHIVQCCVVHAHFRVIALVGLVYSVLQCCCAGYVIGCGRSSAAYVTGRWSAWQR
ncbi:Retrovirus-related Pol polyprotein from type-1 retrotransposable element R1 [Eumeta japonica]|uniref:Retrovirus-related Pol polyprotein from type-1 retrotransposable element R1 n=1 Tax=Eumeta variegata TaxID=151549 RepID=A0A4C2A921_EUMVA|nr:Retrovirus-related Pol polyprotein from type-1 retrotransposable element R1 [Eumeta japonica]